MKPEAVRQAYERLERAKAAAATLSDPNRTLGDLSSDWSAFIMAANSVYTKLEQGAKGDSKSKYWYDMQKNIRRKDPLLRYLRAARNSDEHSLELVSGIGISGKSLHESTSVTIDETRTKINIDTKGAPEPGAQLAQLQVELYPRAVTDSRFNDRFDPPDSHLGQPIADQTAFGIATLAIRHLGNMISEAAALLVDKI